MRKPERDRENALNVSRMELPSRISRHSYTHTHADNFGDKEEEGGGGVRLKDDSFVPPRDPYVLSRAIDLSDLINENSRTRSIRFNYAGTYGVTRRKLSSS